MVWVRRTPSRHLARPPRWQVFMDFFEEGMLEEDPAYTSSPAPNLWQPRRGFGLLWRNNTAVRERIGWATQQWELPYTVLVQTAVDGTIFVSDPIGGLFGLVPGATNWQLFTGI
jgi:hypothetical protein